MSDTVCNLRKRSFQSVTMALLFCASMAQAADQGLHLNKFEAKPPYPVNNMTDYSFMGYGNSLLSGTLQLPTGSGPFPVVVLIGGSGPQVRGGFKILADALLAEGIATFEYDKRGSGKSEGSRIETIPVLAADLKAAIASLRKRRDIDGSRLALLGGSQGGAVAPAVAADDPTIRGVVMLAGPMLDGDDLFLKQAIPQMVDPDATPKIKQQQVRLVKRVLNIIENTPNQNQRRLNIHSVLMSASKNGFFPLSAIDMVASALSEPSIYGSAATLKPNRTLRKVHSPVLAIFAGNDVLVPSVDNAPLARQALRYNPDAKVIEIKGVNHLFQLGNASFDGLAQAKGSPFDAPGLPEIVVPWMSKRLASHPLKAREGQTHF